MKANEYSNKCFVTGIILLFIFSTVTSLVIGYDVESKDMELMDDFAFDCYYKYGFFKVNCYRKHFLTNDTEVVEPEEVKQTLELLPTVQSCGPMDSPWPMKCHDTKHTGRSLYSTADNNGAEIWGYKTTYWIESGPIIGDDDMIYFCDKANVYALSKNGSLEWKYKTNGIIWSTPAISEDGTIYIGSYDDFLYAINSNGTLKWKFWAGTVASISSSPAIADDGTIYFGAMGPETIGRIYAVNSNGTEKWHYDTGYWIVSDPAIGDDGTVYIGSGDSYLYALYSNGTLRWRFKTGGIVKSHPSIADDGTIYFDSFDGYLYALYPDGSLKWKNKVGSSQCSSAVIGNDGTIYIGGSKLHAVYPSNGTKKWSYNLGDNISVVHASPAISADNTIYVGAGKHIIAVNSDGTERWRKKIATNWVESSPCIGEDGTVYIGTSSEDSSSDAHGELYAFGHGNNPPSKPTIDGPPSGKINEEHNYSFVSTDADGDEISYYIEWGDGTNSGWTRTLPSGEPLNASHIWEQRNSYTIRAKAKDENDAESDWATLEISMPKNKIINPFERFLENHPYLFLLLRQLLNLQ